MKYYTLRSRKSILDSWIKEVGTDGRLHGDVFNIGTPTFRQSHKIIANLPGGKSVLGKEIRELFVSEKGYTLVSADSSSCQLRLLAHFMNDEAFTKSVIDGKAHDNNAEILTRAARKVLKDQSIVVPRSTAKPFIFAFLYGAGGPKLSSILGMPERVGTALKKQFQKAYPKLDSLINTCKDLAESQGFIPGLDDRPIFTDSAHKALNYLIQGAEAVVMKATVVMIDQRLKEAGIDFRHLLFYHDEHTVEVKEEQAEQARDIIIQCFEDAPKIYGVNIMTCGDCKIGKDYFSVH
jgi:DNA polymerase-1